MRRWVHLSTARFEHVEAIMTSRVAAWLFRRFIEPRVIGFLYVGRGMPPVPGTVLGASEVEVVFRD